MHERMRARRRRVRHEQARRRRRRALSMAAAVAMAVLVATVVRSPLFDLTEVRVTGAGAERTAAVVEASGLHLGENLLFADLAAARERVLALAWVRTAELRRLPPSAVEIRVAQREAIAVLDTGGAAWLVDADGVVVAGQARDGLPVIDGEQALAPVVGEPLVEPAVGNALAVHQALPGPLRSLVVRYHATSVHGLRLLLDAGGAGGDAGRDELVWVRFGAAERVDAKARVIGLLLDEARARTGTAAVELDVRAPDNPVLVPAPGGPGHPDEGDA